MMEYKNVKGLTLIEVLAAITIMSIVLGAGYMLFHSVNSLWNNSTHKYSETAKVNFTLNTISKEMADPVSIVIPATNPPINEIRFQTLGTAVNNGVIKSLVFSGTTLTLYSIVNSANYTSLTTPLAMSEYKNGIPLADNVSAITISPTNPTARYYTLSITFLISNVNSNGTTNITAQTKVVNINKFVE